MRWFRDGCSPLIGVENIYNDGTRSYPTILRDLRAFVSTDAQDQRNWSTSTYGPGGESDGETFDILGQDEIEKTFASFFLRGTSLRIPC